MEAEVRPPIPWRVMLGRRPNERKAMAWPSSWTTTDAVAMITQVTRYGIGYMRTPSTTMMMKNAGCTRMGMPAMVKPGGVAAMALQGTAGTVPAVFAVEDAT